MTTQWASVGADRLHLFTLSAGLHFAPCGLKAAAVIPADTVLRCTTCARTNETLLARCASKRAGAGIDQPPIAWACWSGNIALPPPAPIPPPERRVTSPPVWPMARQWSGTIDRPGPDHPARLARLMRAEMAARYLGLGETKFRELGIASRAIGGAVVWDRRDLDRWADALSGQPLDPVERAAEGADILSRVKGRLAGAPQ